MSAGACRIAFFSQCRQRGAAAIMAVLFLLIVSAFAVVSVLSNAGSDLTDTALQQNRVSALFLAESGLESAGALLSVTPCSTLGPLTESLGPGDFVIAGAGAGFDPSLYFDNATPLPSGQCRVRVQGRVPAGGAVVRTIEGILEQGNFVVNGGFTANVAGWTEVPSQTDGSISWSNAPTSNGQPGSMLAKTDDCTGAACRGLAFAGYMSQAISVPIGTNVTLELDYCKQRTGGTGGASAMDTSVVVVYQGGATYIAWSDVSQPANTTCATNGNTWSHVNVAFPTANDVVEIRLVYDLVNQNGAPGNDSQRQVWFDEIELSAGSASRQLVEWREVIQ